MSTIDVLAENLSRKLKGIIHDRQGKYDVPNVEFEARIFTRKNAPTDPVPFHVAEAHWNNLRTALVTQGLRSTTSTIRSVGFAGHPDRFRITEENGVKSAVHEGKFKFFDYDDELSWVRYSIAEERVANRLAPEELELSILSTEKALSSVRYERYIKRTTYYPNSEQFRSLLKVDLSEVFDAEGKVHYEVEVEMLQALTNYTRVREFLLFCQKITAIFRGTDTYYNRIVYDTFCALVNMNAVSRNTNTDATNRVKRGFVDKSIFNQVRTVKKEDLVSGGIVGGTVRYGISLKTDGLRFALVFSSLGIWLVWPPYSYNLISSTTVFRNEDLTILDGELVPMQERKRAEDKQYKYVYQVFDAIYVRGMDVRTLFLPERLATAKEYIDVIRLEGILGTLLRIHMKSVVSEAQPEGFFAVVERLLDEMTSPLADFVYEGLVFTPWNAAYWTGIDIDTQNDARTLASKAEIVKWKDAALTTIDFRYSIVDGEKYLMVTEWEEDIPGEKKAKDIPFAGDLRYPFNQRTMVDWQSIADNNVLLDSIGEYSFDRAKKQFVYVRDRSEKAHPNTNLTVAIPNWQEINFPITREAITGRSFQLMFYYHLRIKSQLMNEGADTLLDLGAGQGGIIWRWGKYRKIVAVEPNAEHRKEFTRRAALAGLTVVEEDGPLPSSEERFVILIGGKAEETERILKQVHRIAPQGVNTVSLLDVGTFFWESKKVLRASFRTVKKCLAPGGKFVWKMMNGDLVRALPQVANANRSGQVVYGNFHLDYTVKGGQLQDKVAIYIPEGITSEGHDDGLQEEWLTSVDEMYTLFKKSKYDYLWRKLCNEEPFMPEHSLLLSQLFEYGVLQKKGVLVKEQKPEKVRERQVVRRTGTGSASMRTQVLQASATNTGSTPASSTTTRTTTKKPAASRIQTRKTVKIADEQNAIDLSEF